MKKLSRPSGVGAEKQGLFSFQHPTVQMRYCHGRCRSRGESVDFGVMSLHNIRLFTNQPLSTNRESSISTDFSDPRLLQKG